MAADIGDDSSDVTITQTSRGWLVRNDIYRITYCDGCHIEWEDWFIDVTEANDFTAFSVNHDMTILAETREVSGIAAWPIWGTEMTGTIGFAPFDSALAQDVSQGQPALFAPTRATEVLGLHCDFDHCWVLGREVSVLAHSAHNMQYSWWENDRELRSSQQSNSIMPPISSDVVEYSSRVGARGVSLWEDSNPSRIIEASLTMPGSRCG